MISDASGEGSILELKTNKCQCQNHNKFQVLKTAIKSVRLCLPCPLLTKFLTGDRVAWGGGERAAKDSRWATATLVRTKCQCQNHNKFQVLKTAIISVRLCLPCPLLTMFLTGDRVVWGGGERAAKDSRWATATLVRTKSHCQNYNKLEVLKTAIKSELSEGKGSERQKTADGGRKQKNGWWATTTTLETKKQQQQEKKNGWWATTTLEEVSAAQTQNNKKQKKRATTRWIVFILILSVF